MEILLLILTVWLLFKALKLAMKVAWGTAKVAASVLFALAVPLFIGCLIFAGGLTLLIPLAMIALAFGLLKNVVS